MRNDFHRHTLWYVWSEGGVWITTYQEVTIRETQSSKELLGKIAHKVPCIPRTSESLTCTKDDNIMSCW